MHLVIRHEFDGCVREDTQERRRMTLKEPQYSRFLVYLRSSAEGTTPCAFGQTDGTMCQQHWIDTGQLARTRILLIFRIGGLKEDLDTVDWRNDRLCLRKVGQM